MEYINIPLIVTVSGGILIAILSFIAVRNESERKWIPLLTFITALVIIISGLFAGIEQAKTERDILYSITGGDSYCYLDFGFSGKKTNILAFVVHKGKFPLYDVYIDMADLTMFNNLKSYTEQDYLETRTRHKIDDLSPGKAYQLPLIKLKENWNKQDYNIFIHARNGRWIQQERLRIINNKFVHARRVLKGNKELISDISKDYPLNDRGEVDW